MIIDVQPDDLSSTDVQWLVAEHLAGMHAHSPSGHVHAMAIERLRSPEMTFWVARADGALCGCGALKAWDTHTGEVKSMRTRAEFLRCGVGQAILDEIVRAAHRRGYARLLLETGSGEAFAAAHRLYHRNGFVRCDAFGDYTATDFNMFMTKPLAQPADLDPPVPAIDSLPA